MTLLTDERLRALSMINRWGGWVKRDYSVLEHEIIGAMWLIHIGQDHRQFLIHDHEESEFGDVISPVKDQIPSHCQYHGDVARFNERLYRDTGIYPVGGVTDADMAHAEHLTVAVRGDRRYDARPISAAVEFMAAQISLNSFNRDDLPQIWWHLWNTKPSSGSFATTPVSPKTESSKSLQMPQPTS